MTISLVGERGAVGGEVNRFSESNTQGIRRGTARLCFSRENAQRGGRVKKVRIPKASKRQLWSSHVAQLWNIKCTTYNNKWQKPAKFD